MSSKKPFAVYVKREPVYGLVLTVRFEMRNGQGMLQLRRAGLGQTHPGTVYEERDIPASALRAGRFIGWVRWRTGCGTLHARDRFGHGRFDPSSLRLQRTLRL